MALKKIVAAACLLLLVSCATSGKINKVALGMDKTQVIKIMGEPDSISAHGKAEYLVYHLYANSDDSFYGRTTEYYVRLIDGKVDSFGKKGDFDSTRDPAMDLNINKK